MTTHSFAMKKIQWFRYASVSLVLWVAFCGLIWLLTPALLQSVIRNQGSEWLGRALDVGRVEVRPWSMEFLLHDLKIATADGTAAQFSVQRLVVNAELQSLLRLAPVVKAVQVEQPVLHISHWGGGRYDIDDLLSKFKASSPASSTSEPGRFALYNVVVSAGSVQLHDHALKAGVRTHTIRDFNLSLPFLSNFQTYQTVEVMPKLTFFLNDVLFDSHARSTPFAPTGASGLSLRIKAMDLAPYLPYLPTTLPVRLDRGVLDLDVQVDFEQSPVTPRVQLAGRVAVSDLRVLQPNGTELLQLGALTVDMADVRPLERKIHLSQLQLDAPVLHVSRNKKCVLNWSQWQGSGKTNKRTTTSPDVPWHFTLAKLSVTKGVVHWKDAAVQPRAQWGMRHVGLEVQDIQWPQTANAKIVGALEMIDDALSPTARRAPARLQVEGELSEKKVALQLGLQDLDFRALTPYVAPYLVPRLRGTVDAQSTLTWQPKQVRLHLSRLQLKNVALQDGKTDLAGLKMLQVQDATIDLARKHLKVHSVALTQPRVTLERHESGLWELSKWLKTTPTTQPMKAPKPAAPWTVAVRRVDVRQGAFIWEDRSTPKSVKLAVTRLQAQMDHVQWLGKHAAANPMPVSFSADVQSGRTEPGRVQYRGHIRLHPYMAAQGAFKLQEMPLHAVYPYVAGRLNVDVTRADASAEGQLRWAALPAGMQLALQTNAQLEDVRMNNTPLLQQDGPQGGIAKEVLRWKSLRVPQMTLRIAPGEATQVSVDEVIWSDFFTRLVVQNDGQLNVQGLIRPAEAVPEVLQDPAPSTVQEESAPALEPQIHVGPVRLERGTVHFSDLFIQPNYSTDLTDLNGSLSALSSLRPDGKAGLAQLALTGKAEGTAQLQIVGQLNPLVQPITLDIQGKVNDLELSPLSPYSAKYSGYGIERGKLNVDVRYNIQPDGALQASNVIVLNQLTFGDKAENTSASLPVKLAVALLQDPNGVIDVNLPISGSINDPQFRLGPIVLQVIGNLIKKAVIAPFSLLASVFSADGHDASKVSFAAGSSALTQDAQLVLNQLASALQQRPGVIVTVVGNASSDAEQAALRRTELHKMMLRHQLRRAKVTVAKPPPVSEWSAEQYAAVLRAVYRRADMAKPRNLVGMVKEVSVAEMEDLLMAHIAVPQEMVRDLALARSMAVKDYLLSQQVPAQRVFLGATKMVAAEQDWTPSVEMGVSLP
jgi:uncharacterized protein involved in outer membrane biogenesis